MNIVVAGGSGGIGAALVENLLSRSSVKKITATYNRAAPQIDHPDVTWQQVDVTDESAVQDWTASSPRNQDSSWLLTVSGYLGESLREANAMLRPLLPVVRRWLADTHQAGADAHAGTTSRFIVCCRLDRKTARSPRNSPSRFSSFFRCVLVSVVARWSISWMNSCLATCQDPLVSADVPSRPTHQSSRNCCRAGVFAPVFSIVSSVAVRCAR